MVTEGNINLDELSDIINKRNIEYFIIPQLKFINMI